jgi:hypothetical protein
MDDVPLRVCVNVPSNVPEQRGRYATSFPHGHLVSIRMPARAVDAIDAARKLLDPKLSRAMFIRIAATRVAEAIIPTNKDIHDGPSNGNGTDDSL